MAPDPSAPRWLARVDREARPIYLELVRALEAAIRSGELQPGEQLPPQRTVAAWLGLDFTTVTRAYGAARERDLVEGTVGRGTYVKARAAEDDAGRVDLSMNLPPPPEGLSLGALLRETTAAVLLRNDASILMAYHPGFGTLGQKAAAAAWLRPTVGPVEPEQVLVAPGAQAALAAALTVLAGRGAAVVVEALTYPGIKALAAALGLRLIPCPADGEGLLPDALDRLCREHGPAALYLVPTLQNPTTATLPEARRREIARIAEAHGLWIVEDDPYSRLMAEPAPAVAAFAPARTVHVATLSKTLSPGLRIAFVACPDEGAAERIGGALRTLALTPAPLMAAVAGAWIRDGTAEALLQGVRAEARARRALAAELLPAATGSPESIHVWLDLPEVWSPGRLRAGAQSRGLSLVGADAFAVGEGHRNGVRVSLGGPAKRTVLAEALKNVARLVSEAPAPGFVV